MWRTVRMAAFALSVTLLLSGFALAQNYYDDGRYYRGSGNSSQARQYGYQNGYRDGVNRGREEGRERAMHRIGAMRNIRKAPAVARRLQKFASPRPGPPVAP